MPFECRGNPSGIATLLAHPEVGSVVSNVPLPATKGTSIC